MWIAVWESRKSRQISKLSPVGAAERRKKRHNRGEPPILLAFSPRHPDGEYRAMKRVLLAFSVVGSLFSTNASYAAVTAVRDTADTLLDAAPSQETLHEMLSPAMPTDEDDRKEQEEERVTRISELEKKAENPSEMARAAALYELAKLHQERALSMRAAAVKSFRTNYDRWWIGETLVEPELNLNNWKESMLRSVNVLRDFSATLRKDPRIAEVNWLLGSAMARLGNDHCEQFFKQATQQSKTPEWSFKAKLSRADWLADTNRLDDAVKIYAEIRDAAPEGLKPYVTYRLGWANLIKGTKDKAETAFKLTFIGSPKGDAKRFNLRAETARDLEWLWATNDNEKEALAFFDKHGDAKMVAAFRMRQAEEWLRKGQTEKAATFYHAQMVADPENALRPDMYLRLANAYILMGNVAALKKEVDALAKITVDKDDPWFDEHEDDVEIMARAKKMVELLPLAAGFKIYKAAGVEKDPKKKRDLLNVAIKELQDRVKTAKDASQALTIRMMLVQAQIELERYAEALDQLDAIVKMGPKAEGHLVDAALERLKILVKLDGEQTYGALPDLGEVKKPIDLPKLKVRFAAAATDYLKIVPDAENAVNLRFQIAQDLFSYGHYEAALPLFEALAMEFPRAEQARPAIEYCLSMSLKKKNWDELIRLSTAFLNNRNVKGRELRNYIKENLDWAKSQSTGDATVH